MAPARYLGAVSSGARLALAHGLGLAQAMWVIDVENFGPFIVEGDLAGNSLFERENAKIAANLDAAYEGTKPAVLKRFGETDDRGDELI